MFCSECGARSEPGTRFCESCGAPLEAEEPQAPPQPQAAVPDAVPPAGGGGRRGLATRVVPAALGAIALIVVVVLLVQGLGGSGGGADSPEAAVRQLAAAIEQQDGAAAIAVLDPEEVEGLGDVYDSVDLSSGSGDGSGEGSKVSVDGLRLSSQRLGPGVAKVTISAGRMSGRIAVLGSDVDLDFSAARGPDGAGLFAMTREVDGRWYLSPEMTGLQYLVDAEYLPQPEFDSDAAAAGHAPGSPRKLASSIAEAVSYRDATQLVDLASSTEASALRPYAAALQELAGRPEGSLQVDVTDADFAEHDLGNGLVRLDLEHAALDVELGDVYSSSEAQVRLNGFCANVSSFDGSSSSDCDTQVRRLFGVDRFFVVARREDGGLRLAPIATALEYLRLLAEKLGPDGVRRALGTIAGVAPAGQLRPGTEVSGDLNDAGFAVLSYEAAAPGLVALDGRPYLAMLDTDGDLMFPLACPDGAQLYRLPRAGTYHVVAAAGEYRPGTFRASAEAIRPTPANLTSTVRGSIGSSGRLVVFALDFPGTGNLEFNTGSAVASAFAERDEGQEYCAGGEYAGSVEQIFGPESLGDPLPSFSPPPALSPGSGEAYEYFFYGANHHPLLVVSGAPGTRFRGTLRASFE